jgi:hypothetical protein
MHLEKYNSTRIFTEKNTKSHKNYYELFIFMKKIIFPSNVIIFV